MHRVHSSRLPAFRRPWLVGLAAAMLASSTLAIAGHPASHGPDHKNAAQKHEKAAGHEAKGSEHAGFAQKHEKGEGHSRKGSDGSNLLGALVKAAAKSKSDGQDDQ